MATILLINNKDDNNNNSGKVNLHFTLIDLHIQLDYDVCVYFFRGRWEEGGKFSLLSTSFIHLKNNSKMMKKICSSTR